uniref:ML domain-containing protein n=1 Tax=Macrostomum lignano TaxID=282301 RepID=A0A1I8I4N3_9PLAT
MMKFLAVILAVCVVGSSAFSFRRCDNEVPSRDLAVCVVGSSAFSFRRCGGNNDLDVISANVRPALISFPGRSSVSFAGKVTRSFSDLDLKLEVFLKSAVGEVKIPCLFNFGSCNYDRMCSILDRMERENWAGVGTQLSREIRKLIDSVDGAGDRLCPFTPAEVNVSNRAIDLPSLPPLLATIASGQYRVRAQLINRDSNRLMSCFEIEFEMRKAD